MGWGHVNVPCTSLYFVPYMLLYAVRFLVVFLRCMHKGVGWGGGGHVNVPCTSCLFCCYATSVSLEKIICHTGAIDAAWSAVKDFIPNSLSLNSKDLLLYVKCWQWRYVNLHSRLQQKKNQRWSAKFGSYKCESNVRFAVAKTTFV